MKQIAGPIQPRKNEFQVQLKSTEKKQARVYRKKKLSPARIYRKKKKLEPALLNFVLNPVSEKSLTDQCACAQNFILHLGLSKDLVHCEELVSLTAKCC